MQTGPSVGLLSRCPPTPGYRIWSRPLPPASETSLPLMCSSREASPWSPPFWCVGPRPAEARCWGPEGQHWGQLGARQGWGRELAGPGRLGVPAWPESSEVKWLWRRQQGPLGAGGPRACWQGPRSGGEPGCGRFEPGSGWKPLGVGPRDRAHGHLPFGRRPPTWHTGAGYSSHLESQKQETLAAEASGHLPGHPTPSSAGFSPTRPRSPSTS